MKRRGVSPARMLLNFSVNAAHRHVVDLLGDELIQEVNLVAPQRSRGGERYYRPTFPVVLAADRAALEPVLEDLAIDIAAAFQHREEADAGTSYGWLRRGAPWPPSRRGASASGTPGALSAGPVVL